MVCVDASAEDSCYGRFAQDPIDDEKVNAKIKLRNGKVVVMAMMDIDDADEILVSYGGNYWEDRLHLLERDARRRLRERYKYLERAVNFEEKVRVATYQKEAAGTQVDIEEEEIPLKQVPTKETTRRRSPRLAQEEDEEVESEDEVDQQDPEAYQYWEYDQADDQDFDQGYEPIDPETSTGPPLEQFELDELAFENVDECEALADELQFLNGRKFRDEGRLYEIFQVHYDQGS
eukprot:gene2761-2853_t